MPETKAAAKKRAKKRGIPQANVVKAKKGGHYIAPVGVKSAAGKKAYAECRTKTSDKAKCAKISHFVDDKKKKKK